MPITPISPTINLPIASEAVTIDIAPTSQFGQSYDVARITTIIRLVEPLATPQKFLLPKTEELWSPKMTTEKGEELQFSLDGVDAGALEQLKQQLKTENDKFLQDPSIDNRQLLQQLSDKIYQLSQFTTVQEVPVGTTLIKFSFTKPVQKDASGLFMLENIVPMASFTMQNGSRIHATVLMPFDPLISPDKVEGTWSQNMDGSNPQPVREDNFDNRTILHAYWQQDPMLTIKYRY